MRTLLALLLPVSLAAQGTLLQIRVIEGEGAVHQPGSRSAGFLVQVANEVGKPVSGAVVSFRLPDDGASGAFANGLASEIVTTGADGRASPSPIRWNRLTGALEIRVTAIKDGMRAGTVVAQYLSGAAPAPGRTQAAPVARPTPRHGKGRWIIVAVVLAGAAGAGFAAGRNGSVSAPARAGVDIGIPSVSIGKP
jgi:hypothetical protein